jgi:antitoxin (DNA-binding transcriptional repressor) of toxin-antitoxin stability system
MIKPPDYYYIQSFLCDICVTIDYLYIIQINNKSYLFLYPGVKMKFITVRDFRSKPTAAWSDLKNSDELVLTSNGKPIALLTSVSEDNLEETLRTVRKAKAMATVLSIQTRSVKRGGNRISLDEINEEINAARKARS